MERFFVLFLLPGLFIACAPERDGGQDKKPGSAPDQRPSIALGDSMFASPEEEHLKKELFHAQQLERTLEGLEGVREVRVHLSLAHTSILSKSRNEPSTASILVRHTPSFRKDKRALQEFASNALNGLLPEHVQVLFTETSAEPEEGFVRLGPIVVTQSTALAAKLCIGGLLVLSLLLASSLILVGLKLRKKSSRALKFFEVD